MRLIACLTMLTLGWGSSAVAQPPDPGEAQETLRFIRLAETKKKLNFSEEKLLKVNELLDVFEQKKIEVVRSEHEIRRQIIENNGGDDDEAALLQQLIEAREAQHQNEMALWREVQTFLTAGESLELWLFYDRFQKEVYRRIRSIREERKPFKQGNNRRRRPR